MGVNLNDRRRVSSLIDDEFRSRIATATRALTDAEIADEIDAILSKNRMHDKVAKLQQARDTVAALEKQLSIAAVGLRGPKKASRGRRYDSCECHEDFEEVLKEVASASLDKRRKSDATSDKLHAEKRRLLAKVEVAKSVDDLEKIVKQAGLI